MPEEKEIRHMFKRNPDGAGFALQGDIYGDGRFLVEYHKGFMNVDDLIEALGPREKLKNLTVAIHCRIKTSGETDKFTTHPFPISNQYADLKKTDGKGPVLFHNGVFTGLGGIIDKNSSDTQDFVVGVASRFLKNAKMPGKISQAIVAKIAGDCRILIMYPKREFPLLRFGTWHEHNGCWYSNLGYYDEEEEKKWGGKYGYGGYNRYHYGSTRSTAREELDEWGCNVACYAWPSYDDNWIRFNDARWESLKKAMTDIEEKAGETQCKFATTGSKMWIVDEDYKEIYTPSMRETAKMRQDEEEYIAAAEMDGGIYCEGGCYMYFNEDDEMLMWLEKAKKVGDYEYKFAGKTWLIDTINLEAYTEEGLKRFYKSGEIGHVRRQLREKGYYQEHAVSTKFEDNAEDEIQKELALIKKDEADLEEEKEMFWEGRS